MHTAADCTTTASEAIATFEAAALRFRAATVEEMLLQHTKPLAKHDAIVRLMATENALTGKPHSASSADALAESDSAYAAHLQQLRIVVTAKLKAEAEMTAAKLRVTLATAALLTVDDEATAMSVFAGAPNHG